MKYVDPLKEGDIVDIVAPSFRCTAKEFHGAVRFLKQWGFKPRVPKDIFGKSVLFSNTDEKRFLHLKKAFEAKDSKAIWCLRGGYGAIRLLERLDKMRVPKKPKWLLGYSDITSLHEFLLSNWKWVTFHSPLLDRLGQNEFNEKEKRDIRNILTGKTELIEFDKLKVLYAPKKKFKMTGEVHGGNLTVLQSSMGTPFQMKSHKGFVFFEDIGERPHRVDRMLTQMSLSGVFDNTKAILLGDFMLSNKIEHKEIFEDVFMRFAIEKKMPVIYNMPCGHNQRQRMLPLGTDSVLEVSGGRGTLIVESGVHI